MMKTLDSLIVKAASYKSTVVAVASAADVDVLEAVVSAIQKNLASFLLFDDEQKLKVLIEMYFPQLMDYPISICLSTTLLISVVSTSRSCSAVISPA